MILTLLVSIILFGIVKAEEVEKAPTPNDPTLIELDGEPKLIEADNEMGSSRADVALNISANPAFKVRYENLFGPLPDLTGVVAPAKPDSSDPQTLDNWNALSEVTRRCVEKCVWNLRQLFSIKSRK